MTDTERKIVAAQGYVELQLYAEAREELRGLPSEALDRAEVVELRLLCLMMGEGCWAEALPLSKQLCEMEPDEPGGFIHAAYCLHELGRTIEAVEMLAKGPPALRTKPVYYYNLGCYHASLGNHDEALRFLEQSFEMDGRFRRMAREDPDLKSLWAALEKH
tara:strand:+ start:2081 stop:2563 length:483 start_codon:yes stop_codon:yes gene_type:complete